MSENFPSDRFRPSWGPRKVGTCRPWAARAARINTAVLWHECMLARSARGGANLFKIQLWYALLKTNKCSLATHSARARGPRAAFMLYGIDLRPCLHICVYTAVSTCRTRGGVDTWVDMAGGPFTRLEARMRLEAKKRRFPILLRGMHHQHSPAAGTSHAAETPFVSCILKYMVDTAYAYVP